MRFGADEGIYGFLRKIVGGSAYGREVFRVLHISGRRMRRAGALPAGDEYLCPAYGHGSDLCSVQYQRSGSAGVWNQTRVRRDGGPGRDGRDKNGGAKLCGPHSEGHFVTAKGGRRRERKA